jgi:hypothetical protein
MIGDKGGRCQDDFKKKGEKIPTASHPPVFEAASLVTNSVVVTRALVALFLPPPAKRRGDRYN